VKKVNKIGAKIVVLLGLVLPVEFSCVESPSLSQVKEENTPGTITLPEPRYSGAVSVEEVIFRRRCIRSYKGEPLTLQEVSQLLWAAGGKTVDGITGATRAYPSAGGLYPLEVYLVAGEVEGLAAGVYRYRWRDHTLRLVKEEDLRRELMKSALNQGAIGDAPVSVVFTAIYARTTGKYGERGAVRYVHMDMGAAVQTLFLQAEALGLGAVVMGAFEDEAVKGVLGVEDEEPLAIMPVGRR